MKKFKEQIQPVEIQKSENIYRIIPISQEPKRKNRFMIEFPAAFDIPSYVVQEATCPQKTIGLFSSSWKDITVKFIDIIGPSASAGLYREQNSKNFILTLSFLDPTGVVIETWEIHVKKIKSIDFGGGISYGDDSIKTVTAVFKIKKCVLLF